MIIISLKLLTDVSLLTQLGKELKYIVPAYLKVILPMLRLGFVGCRSLLLVVA